MVLTFYVTTIYCMLFEKEKKTSPKTIATITKLATTLSICPHRVLAQRPRPEEAP